MAKTGADPDRRESFNFYQLLRAVEDRLSLYKGADRLLKIDPKKQSLRQLVKQFRNQQPVQRDKVSRNREGRLLDLVRPGVHRGALVQQQSPATNQAAVQGLAQGYGLAPGYEDWQNSTQHPQDFRPPQGSRPPQGFQPPQDSQYPQDSTAFGRPQWDTRGQQGTQGQGQRTCFGCGGSHRFTEHEYQGLKDLIQQGFVHLSNRGRLVAGTRNWPGPVLPWLGNKGRLKGIKDWLRTYQGTDLDRPRKEQTQQPAFYDGVVLQNSNKI